MEEIIKKLRQAKELLENGIITEEEYEILKDSLKNKVAESLNDKPIDKTVGVVEEKVVVEEAKPVAKDLTAERFENLKKRIEKSNKPDELKACIKLLDDFTDKEEYEEIVEATTSKWKETTYNKAINTKNYGVAVKLLDEIKDYKDSAEKLEEFKALALEAKNKRVALAKKALPVVAAIIVVLIIVTQVVMPRVNYKNGVEAFEAKHYKKAVEYFEKSAGYKDSKEYLEKSNYQYGLKCIEKGNYSEAAICFSNCGNIENSKILLNYSQGMNNYYIGEYEQAKKCFSEASGYGKSSSMINACNMMIAEEKFDAGDYSDALALYKALPSGYSLNGISASSRISILNKYSSIIGKNGTYRNADGWQEVKQTSKNYGSWNNWYIEDPNGSLELNYKIQKDGNLHITGTVSFYVYTNFSTIADGLDQSCKTITIDKVVSSVPTSFSIADYTKMSISGGTVKVNYYKNVTNEDLYFNYMYKTDMAFVK